MSAAAQLNSVGSCLARIRARLCDKSAARRGIAGFLVRNPAQARNMSIEALAAACGTSTATVSRFCEALGYSGFKEFQLDLATAVAQTDKVALDDFITDASPETILLRVFEGNRQSLSETEKVLDHKTLIRVAKSMLNADKVVFLGIGGSALVARDAAQRLTSIGMTACAVEDPYEQIFATANLKRGDVVVGISHTGETAHIVEGILTARQRGARTVALTNYPQSSLAEASEFQLITAFREHRINVALSSSRIAQMCVIDSLYFILSGWCGADARKLAEEAETRARKMLRCKSPRTSLRATQILKKRK